MGKLASVASLVVTVVGEAGAVDFSVHAELVIDVFACILILNFKALEVGTDRLSLLISLALFLVGDNHALELTEVSIQLCLNIFAIRHLLTQLLAEVGVVLSGTKSF